MNQEKTEEIHNWMKSLEDHNKMKFAINWCRIPHTLFNVACGIKGGHEELQNVDWYKYINLETWAIGHMVERSL